MLRKVPSHLGGGGLSLLYMSIAYYMQKCKIAYILNGSPQSVLYDAYVLYL